MANLSRFISDDEEDEYLRGLAESERVGDWSRFLGAVKDPSGVPVGSAPTDWRQPRRPDGLGTALAMKETQGQKSQMPTLASGDISGDTNTAKRIQIAQWGMEDPDEDRLTPEQVQSGNKMLSSTDDQPVKPPGPDSPSTGYKEPSRFDKAKAEYDKEFGPGKKHKWYSLESTDAWESRRAAGQHNLMLEQRQEEEERRQVIGGRVRPSGQAMRMIGDQGDGIYQGYSDGTFKKVGGVLDKDADQKDEYGETIFYDAQGRAMVKKKGSYQSRYLEDPNAGQPLANGTQGPTDPYVDRWVAPQKEQTRVLGRGSTWLDEDGNVIGRGQPVPPSTGGGGAAPKNPDVQAKKDAEKEADELLKGNKEYERASPEARKATRDMWIRKILEGNKSGGAAPAKPKRTVVVG